MPLSEGKIRTLAGAQRRQFPSSKPPATVRVTLSAAAVVEGGNFHGEVPFGKADKGPYLGRTTKVGSYMPNKLGLYDTHGNVWQWCEDLWEKGDSVRVLRGGSWDADGTGCQAALRRALPSGTFFSLGFRLARVPVRSEQGK